MKRILTAAAIAVLVTPVAAVAAPVNWEIDPAHSSATFSIRHLGVANVKGQFTGVKGMVVIDEQDFSKSSAQATIDASTIDTNQPKRDAHLKSADFFDVQKYPTITFKSKSWKKTGDQHEVTGDLTMHGVTKEVKLTVEELTPEVKDPSGNVKRGASATTTINRKDFGLNWNQALETGGVLVGDDVKIMLELELLKTPAPAPKKAKDPTR